MANPSTSLYNVEIEANSLSTLLQFPDTWADFYMVGRDDWSEAHKPLYDIISQQLGVVPNGSVAPLVLAEKLKGYGMSSLTGGFEVFPYLEGLTTRFVEKKDGKHLAQELKRLTVRRQLVEKLDESKRTLIATPNASFIDMTSLVEKNISSINTTYYQADEFTNIFGDIVEVTESRADNPLDVTKMGWMGPFETINRTLGALTAPGLFTTIGARTGNQKSSLGFHYHLHLAETYNLPVLLLDVGEMTKERIQRRAVCCLSKGRVPLWAIASGEWRQNKEWKHIIQDECWPRVKKLRIDYINVGNLNPREKIALIRRYYYSKVGRGNQLAILDDYLKGIEALGKNTSEHQSVGYYVNDVKNLITGEIPASFFTSVQNNRSGTHQGKKAADLTDSEDQMGLSDRIIQQSDWGFILRFKVPEEIGAEREQLGNMRLTPVKMREAMGKDFEKALRPVKLPNGKFVTNYFNLKSQGFHFTECGDLRKGLELLGSSIVDLGINDPVKAKAL